MLIKNLAITIFMCALSFTLKAQEKESIFEVDEHYIDNLEQTIGDINLTLTKLDDNYYMISGEGVAGNIGVFVGNSGVYMIDNQWTVLSQRIKEIVATLSKKPIKLIINTHYHFDHTNGNLAFGRDGIPILAHTKARERMQKRQVLHGHVSQVQNPYSKEGLPTLTFDDKMKLHDGEEIIELKYFPKAHTDGDIIVHFRKADIYHMGDIFVTYGIPVIDSGGGGDIYALVETIDYILSNSKETTKFIPGHGPICTQKEMRAFSELLHTILNSVEKSVRSKKSLDETITEVKNRIGDEVGGISKDRFITLVYPMVKRKLK